MKSNKGELIQIRACLEAIQKLDELIELHRSGANDFMVSQYESKKLGLFKELLSLLIHSTLNTSSPQTFVFVSQLIEEYYPESLHKPVSGSDVQPVATVVKAFLDKKSASYPRRGTAPAVFREDAPNYVKKES